MYFKKYDQLTFKNNNVTVKKMWLEMKWTGRKRERDMKDHKKYLK